MSVSSSREYVGSYSSYQQVSSLVVDYVQKGTSTRTVAVEGVLFSQDRKRRALPNVQFCSKLGRIRGILQSMYHNLTQSAWKVLIQIR